MKNMADNENGTEEEFELAQQMRDEYCDRSGKETNPAKAAEIIYQIGQIYRKRSPDKISLIKSVGLFNAAIIRNPLNISDIKSDLAEICQHILQQAKSKNQNADLVKKAEQVKASITSLRRRVTAAIQKSVPKVSINLKKKIYHHLIPNKISAIQRINKTTAIKYTEIMAEIGQFCEDVMGKPPCNFAIVGMGSLAREEITPYSDFEHIILLSNDKNCKSYLEYFQWYSVIFHVIILNVQETIIPSLNVRSLNDKDSKLTNWFYDAITPRGISFDGMMPHACKFPLGRQQITKHKQFKIELIKPVKEMLEYLSFEADLKNGYHLADILTKTCFVFGNKDIFMQFKEGVQIYQNQKSRIAIVNDIQQQIKDDLDSFSTRFRLTELNSQNTINIKQLVYRSITLFISALARIHNISTNSCFGIICKMTMSNKITENTANKLLYAIAIACEMRLRVYMEKKSQCDNVINIQTDGIEKFLNIVGVQSTINYFQITYCLQCEVAKQLNFTKIHFYSDSKLINITIGLAFGMKDLVSSFQTLQKPSWNLNKFDFDECINQLEAGIQLKSIYDFFQRLNGKFSKRKLGLTNTNNFQLCSSSNLNAGQIKSIADCLYSANVYDEAFEFYKQFLVIYSHTSKHTNYDNVVAWANEKIGMCLIQLNQPANALDYLKQAHEIRQNTTRNAAKDRSIATTLHNIGFVCCQLNNYNDALTYFNRANEIKRNLTLMAEKDRGFATSFHNIGSTLIYLHDYDDALVYFKRALQIKQNITFNVEKDTSIAMTFNNIGCCHIGLGNYNNALMYLNKAFRITQATTLDVNKDCGLAKTLRNMGRCFTELRQFDKAMNFLEQSLEIFQNASLEEEKDICIGDTFGFIGECLTKHKSFAEAQIYLQRAVKIYQSSMIKSQKDTRLARTLYSIGICLIELQDYTNALSCLTEALEIYESFSLNDYIKSKITLIRSKIIQCC